MMLLVYASIRLSIVVAAGLAVTILARGQSAATRHAVLAGAVVAAVIAVPLSWTLPGWSVALPSWPTTSRTVQASVSEVVQSTVAGGNAHRSRLPEAETVIAGIWILGVGVSATALGAALVRVRYVRRQAIPVTSPTWLQGLGEVCADHGVTRPVTLLQTDSIDLLATWGFRRPCVALPRGADRWDLDRIRAVLFHEIAHVQRLDWPLQLFVQGVCAVQWFNPLCWLVERRLRDLSEMACDDQALTSGVAADEYAIHLLEITRSCRPSSVPLSALPMARPSTLERRIAAMLNHRVDRTALSRRALAGIAAGLLVLAAPVAVIHAAGAGPQALTGVVYDASGGLLPGAAVTLDNTESRHWQATTDASGRFAIDAVPAGRYALRVSQAGFKALAQDVELSAPADWSRMITLQVGDVQETMTVESQRTAGAPQTPPTRLKVGGNIRAPRKLVNVNAVYPESMKAAGIEGKVQVEAVIGKDGSVQSVRVLTAQIHPDLAIAATDAVRQWKFEPTLLNGAPVEVAMKVTIDFRLKG